MKDETNKKQRARSRRYAKLFAMVRQQYLDELALYPDADDGEKAILKYKIKQLESDICDEVYIYFNFDSETAFPVSIKEDNNKPSW